MSFPEEIPSQSLHKVRDRIKAIRRMDYKKTSIDFYKDRMRFLLVGYRNNGLIVKESYNIFRGRVFENGRRPHGISDLSYPEPASVKWNGRLNRAGVPIFYGSLVQSAPFFEIGAKKGQVVAVARWKPIKELMFNTVAYHDQVFAAYGSERNVRHQTSSPEMTKPATVVIRNFFSEEFARKVTHDDDREYSITVAIAELLNQPLTIDPADSRFAHHPSMFAGIQYPSLAMKANADNVAINTRIVDELLRWIDVELIRIEGDPAQFKFDTTTLDYSNSVDASGALIWKGRPPEWRLETGEMRVSVEDGRWVARLPGGQVVEPD